MQFYEHEEGPAKLLSILPSAWRCPLRITILKASVSVIWVAGLLDVCKPDSRLAEDLTSFSVICSYSKAQVSVGIAASPAPSSSLKHSQRR